MGNSRSKSAEELELGDCMKWTDAQKNDRAFMLKAVKLNGTCLRYAGPDVLADREVVLQALRTGHNFKVTGGGMVHTALQYVKSAELLDDRELIMEAVNADNYGKNPDRIRGKDDSGYVGSGSALEYASDRLKGDREIVITAVKNMGWVFAYASPELKADKEFVKLVVQEAKDNLAQASAELQQDEELLALFAAKFK
jgi:hypothetical protein